MLEVDAGGYLSFQDLDQRGTQEPVWSPPPGATHSAQNISPFILQRTLWASSVAVPTSQMGKAGQSIDIICPGSHL